MRYVKDGPSDSYPPICSGCICDTCDEKCNLCSRDTDDGSCLRWECPKEERIINA